MKAPYLSSLGARRIKHGFGHRTSWAMWSVAVLFAVLSVAVPMQRTVWADDPTFDIDVPMTGTIVDYETAKAQFTISNLPSTINDSNWVVGINWSTPFDPYGDSKTAVGSGLDYTPDNTFDATLNSGTITASGVALKKMIPDSEYTLKVTLYEIHSGGSWLRRGEGSATFRTKAGCTAAANAGDLVSGSNTKPAWFGLYYVSHVTETELTMVVSASSAYAPENSGRCLYYRYREFGGSTSEILTAYFHYMHGSSRRAVIRLTGLEPGTQYSFTVSVDNGLSDGNIGFSGTTLGENTGISGIDIDELTQSRATATAAIQNASSDDKIVYWHYRESPPDGDPGQWGRTETITTKGASVKIDIDSLDAGTRYEIEASVKENFNPGMSMTKAFVTLPGQPGISLLEAGDGRLTVSWTAPAETPAPLTGYRVQWQEEEEYSDYETFPPPTDTLAHQDVAVDDTSYTIMGLTNGTEYIVHVIAKNESFDDHGGTASNGAYGTPMALPNAPNNLQVAPGNEKLTLTWEAPTAAPGVTVTGYKYKLQWKANTVTDWDAQTGVTEVDLGANVLTRKIMGLTNGTTYDVRVRADNGVTSDSHSWATGSGTPRPDPIVTGVTVPDSTKTQTSAIATVTIDNQTGENQTVNLKYRKNTESGWTTIPTEDAAAADTSVDFDLRPLIGNTVYVVEAWLTATPDTAESLEFTTDPVEPGPPTNLKVTGTADEQITVAWDVPSDNGGSQITGYKVQWKSGNGSYSSADQDTPTASPHTITGLTNGTEYDIQVIAVNDVDDSQSSGEVSGIPSTTPDPPTDVEVSDHGDRWLEVTWAEPTDKGGLPTTYIVQWKWGTNDYSTANQVDPATSPQKITNLQNGTLYTVHVLAENTRGKSGPSNEATGTPKTKPQPPTGVEIVEHGDGTLKVEWTAPTDKGGGELTGFIVQWKESSVSGWASPDEHTITSKDTLTYTINGLTNGTQYTVRVLAVNDNDADDNTSDASNEASDTPSRKPDAPTGVDITNFGDGWIEVTWVAPTGTATGGSPITGYIVQWKSGTDDYDTTNQATPSASPHKISNLKNGTAYTAHVIAVNKNGSSEPSSEDTETPRTKPQPPTGVNIKSYGDGSLTVAWTAPEDDGGSALASFKVQWKSGSETFDDAATNSRETTVTAVSGTTAYETTISGLTNGTEYTVQVLVVNGNRASDNTSSPSNTASGTPSTMPLAPESVTITNKGDRTLTVTWEPPANNGGSAITNYRVQWKDDDDTEWTTPTNEKGASDRQHVIENLTNGTLYTVQVLARNQNGLSTAYGQVTGTPSTKPQPPTDVSITHGDGKLTVSWAAPTDANTGGSEITGFKLQWKSGGQSYNTANRQQTPSASPDEITNLTNGTEYTVQVIAVNKNGDSDPSDGVEGTPSTTPQPPTGVGIVHGDESLTVSWTAPTGAGTGGSPITGFKIQWKLDSAPDWTSPWEAADDDGQSPFTITQNLNNGTKYDVQVIAVNADGDGDPSDEATGTPSKKPNAPSGVDISDYGDGWLEVTWDAVTGTDTGGSPIKNYIVQWKSGSDDYNTTNQATPSASPYRITNLNNGTPYTVRVLAVNEANPNDPSDDPGDGSNEDTETPRTIPEAPTELKTISGDEELTVSWKAPSENGGAAITRYIVQWKSGNQEYDSIREETPTGTSQVIAQLSNGTSYSIRVRADNGETAVNYKWTETTGTPMTVPGVPTNLRAEERNRQLEVSWGPPTDTGGANIEKFVVQWKPDTVDNWDSPDEHTTKYKAEHTTELMTRNETEPIEYTIEGLDNGVMYDVRVRADNSVEGQAFKWAYTTGKPRTIPSEPRHLRVPAGDGQLSLSWGEPSDNGGLNINRYIVQWQSGSQQYDTTRQATTTVLSHTIQQLTNGTLHSVRVRADNTVEADSYNWAQSTGTPAVTRTPPPPPLPPQDSPVVLTPSIASVSADNITKTTARAVVNIDDHDSTELTVELRYQVKADVQDWTTDVKTAEATSTASPATKNLANLTPGTEYVLQASFDDTFPDDATEEHTFTTKRQPSIASVSADNITKTTARAVVNIDDHDGTELTVELRYQVKADVQDWTTDVETAEATSTASPATKNLADLTPGTEYVLQASFDDTFPDDATEEHTFTTKRQPSIQSVIVSNVGRTSARATINIADSDGSTQTAKLQYRITSPQGQWSTPALEQTSTDATVVIDLDSLTADTGYEVQAWLATDATNKKTDTFRTSQAQQQRSPVAQKPSISSVTFINITQTSTVTNVSLQNAGTGQKIVRLHYRADGTTSWSTPPKTSKTKSSGTTISLTGLTAGTTYEVQVWLTSSLPPSGTEIYEFTTLDEEVPDPSISDLEFENIGQTSATAMVKIADAGTEMKEVYLKHSIQGEDNWSMLPTPTTTYRDSASIALDGLQEQTIYEVAVALSGDFNGMTIGTFTTLAGPSLSGVSISGITQTSAVATVNIADAGTAQKTVSLRHRRFGETEWDTAQTKTTTDESAAFDLTGLSPQTKYEVETALSSDFTATMTAAFTTLSPDPGLSGITVKDIRQTIATAKIEIANPGDSPHTVHLRYRTTPQGEWSSVQTADTVKVTVEKEQSNGETTEIVTGRATINMSGLSADTEYEVQASLDSAFEETLSATFTTLRYPSLSGIDVTDITKTTATAELAIADPDGSSQTVHLRYRTTTPQGDWSGALTTTSTTAEASINLTGLITDTEYEVEVSLTSDFTVAVSDTFRTLPPDPVVSEVSMSSIRQTTATAGIDIANVNGGSQTVSLRYRTITPRGDWSDIQTTMSTTAEASIDLSGLTPGTEYDVQASLDGSFPTVRTKHATFATLRYPSIDSVEAENIGRNGATISATIADSHGSVQTVYVRHSRAQAQYTAWRPTQQTDSVEDVASIRLRGLSSGTEYIAEASLDSSFSPDETKSVTFTTRPRDDDDSSSEVVAQAARAANVPLLGFSPQMLRFTAIEGGDNPPPQAFLVWNRAQGVMSFTLSNQQEWLSQQPTSGVSNGPDDQVTITASVDSSALASGQYVDIINIDVSSSGKSPAQVIVVLDVLPPDYIRQFVSRDEGAVVILPDGTVKLIVQPLAPPKDVDIELMKVNLQAHGQPPGEKERVVVAIESNTYPPGGDTPEDVAYAPYVELWVQLPQEDAAACDEGKTRVYSVEAETWSLVEHRCETDESDKVWVVAQVDRLGAFALVIDDAPVSATPTPVAAAVAATATPTAIPASAPAVAVQRISLPAQPPTPVPTSVPTAVPMPNVKTTVAPAMAPTPTPTAVPAGNEPSAPMMQASASDGGSGGFGRIILAALGVPMLIGTLIVVYLLYRERRRRDDARMI